MTQDTMTYHAGLDRLLAERRAELAQQAAEAEQKQQQERQDERESRVRDFTQSLAFSFSEQVRDMLGMDNVLTERTNDTSGHEHDRPYALVQVGRDTCWHMRESHYYGEWTWRLASPDGFEADVHQRKYDWEPLSDDAMLDAIDQYPAWAERQREMREIEQAHPAAPKPAPRYHNVDQALHAATVSIGYVSGAEHDWLSGVRIDTYDDFGVLVTFLNRQGQPTGQTILPRHAIYRIDPCLPDTPAVACDDDD